MINMTAGKGTGQRLDESEGETRANLGKSTADNGADGDRYRPPGFRPNTTKR
ncbi:MAG: hypothetical protein QOG10_1122 [Kribbellaceae bacterium]|nr:hypothetical protein [Kribbellaceae bacterium]